MTLAEKAAEIKRKSLQLARVLRLLEKPEFIDYYLDLPEDTKKATLLMVDQNNADGLWEMYETSSYDAMTVKELRIIAVRKGLKYANIYDKWNLIRLLRKKDANLEAADKSCIVKGRTDEVVSTE